MKQLTERSIGRPSQKPWAWNEKSCRGLCCKPGLNEKKRPLPIETEIRDWNISQYGRW